MELKTELKSVSQRILLVDKTNSHLAYSIKEYLKKFDNNIFISPRPLKNLSKFDMVFLIDQHLHHQTIINYSEISEIKTVLIFLNQKNQAEKLYQFITKQSLKKIKIINIEGNINLTSENLNNLLWFVFSRSKERFLNIFQLVKEVHYPKVAQPKKLSLTNFLETLLKIKLSKLFFWFLAIFLIYQIFFIPFLVVSSYYYYQAVKSLQTTQPNKSRLYANQGANFYNISRNLYQQPQSFFRLFSLAGPFDNLFTLNEKTASFLNHTDIIYKNTAQLFELFLKKDKTAEEKKFFLKTLSGLSDNFDNLSNDIIILNQKIPGFLIRQKKIKQDIYQATELMQKVNKLLPQMDDLLAKDTAKKYLLLFANNMELRPGGGFIGSFGILTIKDLTFEELKIYDVYDADGQLVGHVDPPDAIRKHLNQPHWFLRDSAFSGDFTENYQSALFFLKKEMNFEDFNGAILLTTTAIQNIIGSYNKFYLPDYNELITAENFYLKAQYYAEKDFFPGSAQKKSFLGAVARYLLANLSTASSPRLAEAIKKSLDEKQMVIFSDNNQLQDQLDALYWSGKIIQPECPANLTNCLADYFFPLDANLGVNKANFYVNRTVEANISFDQEGYYHNKLIFRFKNESPKTAFPGGPYKNYFQVLLPVDTIVKQVTKDDILIEELDQSIDRLKRIGFYFIIEPQTTVDIQVEYQSTIKLERGRSYYQLLVQKQIGYNNNDLAIQINLPNNMHLTNQNFSPLVKNNQILYNSQLSTDKIFFLELLRE